MATETVIQQVGETPEIEAYRIGLLKSAKELSDKGITLPQSKIADFTGLQNASFNRVSDYYGQDGTGIAGYQPYMDQAATNFTGAGTDLANSQALTGQRVGNVLNTGIAGAVNPAIAASMLGGNYGMGAATQGIAGLSGLSNQYDPNSYQQYMDPYMNDVIQQQYQDIQRQGDIQKQGANAQAVGSGAFGGSRQGIQQAEINRNVLDQQARTGSQLRSAGFQQASNMAQQAAAAQAQQQLAQAGQFGQQAGQIGAQAQGLGGVAQGIGSAGQGLGSLAQLTGQLGSTTGALGQTIGQLGTSTAGLGQLGQQMGVQDINSLMGVGALGQQQAQKSLDVTRANDLAQQNLPYQQIGFMSDIFRGVPALQQTTATTTAPGASTTSQMLGLAQAGIGAYGMMNQGKYGS